MAGKQQRQNAAQVKKEVCYSPMSENNYDETDGFVVIDDELRARWDGDQTKYVPPTPFQSAVSTAKYSWKNLSLETIQDGLDAIGGAAANHLTTAVTGLTQQVPAESSISAPRAQKSFKQDFKNWEPETNFFTKEEQEDALNLHRTKDLKTDKKLRRKMNEKRQNSAFQHGKPHYGQAPSHRDSLGVENQEELGPIFEQEKQFNPTGLSAQWQRQVRGEGSNDRKQRIRTEWHDKEDRGTRQEKIYAGSHAGEGSSIPPKHTHLTRRNKDRDNRKRMDEPARDAVHEKRKDGNSAATIEKAILRPTRANKGNATGSQMDHESWDVEFELPAQP